MSKTECGAKKRDGSPCKQPAMENGRCRLHGGKTPRGIASPHFVTGKYSKYLPENLLTAYEDAQSDENLLSVRGDIHLLDALIRAKLVNLDTNDSSQHWIDLLKYIIKARRSYKNSDMGGLEEALDEMEALADKRRLHYATEQEITSQLEQRRKLVDTEQKIILGKQQAITYEQAMLLMSAVLESVKRNVTDATALTAIQADFIQLIGGNVRQRIDAGDSASE
jgi:hypothetical protein